MCALSAAMNPSSKGLLGWDCTGGQPSTAVCSGSSSNWGSVTCSAGVVTAVLLGGFTLVGTIPAEIALLTALVRLELQSNRITGTLPTSIGRASGLTYLNVNGNSLVGVVPDGIGALSSMRYLNLGGNSLAGSLPSTLCSMSSLSFLNIANNPLVCYWSCLSSVASRNVGSVSGSCTAGKHRLCDTLVVVFISFGVL